MEYIVAWLSTLRLTTLGGRGGRCGILERATGGIQFCIEYRYVPWVGEEVRPGDGVGRVEVRGGIRYRVGRMKVDEGGAYFRPVFDPSEKRRTSLPDGG